MRGIFWQASMCALAVWHSAPARAVTPLNPYTLLPVEGKQFFVEIEFQKDSDPFLALAAIRETKYNAFDKITGEYLYGNEIPVYFSLVFRNGVFEDGGIGFNHKFRNNTLSYWARLTKFDSEDGCLGDTSVRCEQVTYFTDATVTTGGQPVTVRISRISAVPEPASWALMIAGFGLVGTSLRRARNKQVA